MTNLDEHRLKRIALHLVSFKNQKARRFLQRHAITPEQLFSDQSTELTAAGFTVEETGLIGKGFRALAEPEAEAARRHDIQFIFREESLYPALLREIFDPPDFLYCAGDPANLEREKLAVVGSRQATTYGRNALQRVLADVCRSGLAIVSGMAYGIDSLAHAIALQEGAATIGVNAGGLLHLYPAGNIALIRRIRASGGIVSEFPLNTIPRPFLFPVRNRLIAGMAKAVLVAEAAQRSGSLITARLALEQNRDILAIPGNIDSPNSQGTNSLIQAGAKCVVSSADILVEFGLEPPAKTEVRIPLSAAERKVLDLLPENEVKSIDDFVDALNLSPAEIISQLMGLVLKDRIRDEGGLYRKI